jgi:biotin carboxyl carrier protein
VLVDDRNVVQEGDVICLVQQMNMELGVTSPRIGKITRRTEAQDGEDVAEGTLAAIIHTDKEPRA